jgi:hypothetical protein
MEAHAVRYATAFELGLGQTIEWQEDGQTAVLHSGASARTPSRRASLSPQPSPPAQERALALANSSDDEESSLTDLTSTDDEPDLRKANIYPPALADHGFYTPAAQVADGIDRRKAHIFPHAHHPLAPANGLYYVRVGGVKKWCSDARLSAILPYVMTRSSWTGGKAPGRKPGNCSASFALLI